MTISSDYEVIPLNPPLKDYAFVDPETGKPTDLGVAFLRQVRDFLSGCARIIPCNLSTTTNVVTITPTPSAPKIEGYKDFDCYAGIADATTTGAVTATVVPANGSLATIKVYKTAGAAQAGAGDIVQNSLYLFFFADHLDSGAGGFVLK